MNRQSFYFVRLGSLALIFFMGAIAFADHPNEGSLSLEQLIKEAASQNFDLKEADSYLKASEAESKSQYGKLLP